MSKFDQINKAPEDPIFGLSESFKKDPRPDKIDLSVGIYKNREAKAEVFEVIKEVEDLVYHEETSKVYLPMAGLPQLRKKCFELIFGQQNLALLPNIAAVQTLGGTGALRIAIEFCHHYFGKKPIYFSKPTWPNHLQIAKFLQCDIREYPYFDSDKMEFHFDAMLQSIEQAEEGAIILLQTVCHNPSGISPTHDEWDAILRAIKKKQLLPIFDLAYQGFGQGLDEDAWPIRKAAELSLEFFIAYSFSKNMGLYGERTGCLLAHLDNSRQAEAVESQLSFFSRVNYSNPPRHGALIAATVLNSQENIETWHQQLVECRAHIDENRKAFADAIEQADLGLKTDMMRRAQGMFTFLGINKESVVKLRKDYGIYMTGSGRVNLCGLTLASIPLVVDAVKTCIKHP